METWLETRDVFENWRSGELPSGINVWNEEHKEYNDAVQELFNAFLERKDVSSEKLTPDQAREFITEVLFSDDPRIDNFKRQVFGGKRRINEEGAVQQRRPRLPGGRTPGRGGGDEE